MKQLLFVFSFIAFSAMAHSDPAIDRIFAEAAANQVKAALRQAAPIVGKDKELVVPNAKVAEAIHLAVAGAVFGERELEAQRPFRAVRSGGFWVVFGSLPAGQVGGTAVTVIRAGNGEVLRVVHEQ